MLATPTVGVALYLFWVLMLMPLLGFLSWLRVRSGKPLAPKEKRYRAMILLQVWLFAFSFLVMQENGLNLFSSGWPPLWGWMLAVAYMLVIVHQLKVGWKKMSEERKQRARRLLPESNVHLRYWVPISLLAGLTEEYAFRGVAFTLINGLTHSQVVAVAVCTISFGLAHMIQGWRGVLGTSIIALVMHGLVYVTGGLYLPIAMHAAYDLIVGIIAMRAFAQPGSSTLAQSQAASG